MHYQNQTTAGHRAWTSRILTTLASVIAMPIGSTAFAQKVPRPGVSDLDLVQVTSDRFADSVQEVPDSIEVITAEELRARGVNDLRTALSLVGGAQVAPGGDNGPAGAVPGLVGLREIDDLLLVIDGVPAGGVFLPQFATLNLNNVERIEVQRGPAPVIYGTTAFAGTINVIHYAAGGAEKRIDLSYGSHGSVAGGVSTVLAQGAWRSSLDLDGSRDRYSDPRAALDQGHLQLRNGADVWGGTAKLDFEAAVQHQLPLSPRPLEGGAFDPETPVDFNQNPADGRINTDRFQLASGFDREIALGSWNTTLSVTQTRTRLVQGFFNADSDAGSGSDNASGFDQSRNLTELYFDSHVTHRFTDSLVTTLGVGELYGRARQKTQTFTYSILADGSVPPSSAASSPEDGLHLSDWRSFGGIYAQTRWNISTSVGVLAGLRLNRTDEQRSNGTADAGDEADDLDASTTRLSGSLGVNWRIWQDREAVLDDVVLYANYSNTFQPPAIDFGPDSEGPILRPETATSYQAGMKADGFDGRLSLDLSVLRVDFRNQAVATLLDNLPGLTSAGQERFRGLEAELRIHSSQRLLISAEYSYNDARYRDFLTLIDSESRQLSGKQLPLSPHTLVALGVIYGGGPGLQASVVANFVGSRFLDIQNEAGAGSYATVDATLGYAFRRYSIALNGYNLGNRRDPAGLSELGEGQIYPLIERRVFVKFSVSM